MVIDNIDIFKKESLDEDTRIYINIPNAKENLMEGLQYFCGKDAQWLPEYDNIVSWLEDNNERGLLCIGNCGRGKTLITQKILPVLFRHYHRKIVNTVTATNLSKKFNELSELKIISIDDVGFEGIGNNYGEKHLYFAELVDLAEREDKMLIISTNLSVSEIREKYGERTIDRLRAITKPVLFTGESLRK